MIDKFPLVEIEGPPQQRGQSYGRAAGEQIRKGVEIYREGLANAGLDWDEAVELARRFTPDIAAYDEAMVEEVKAIALGAEQPFEHIVILNTRTEILFWKTQKPELDDCTAVLAAPSVTRDGVMLHGQNWDWNPKCEESGIVLRIRSADAGPDILTFVEAGQLARSGMNSAGIALTANGLHAGTDYGRSGVPSPFVRRRLLAAPRLAPALRTIMAAPVSFSHFLLVSECSGEAVGLETTPDDVFWIRPQDGILTHANHFKAPAALAQVRDLGVRRTPETLYRDSRVEAVLREAAGSITVDTFEAALADEYGKPDAVLRSPAPRPGGNLSATVATIIMDTTRRRMWLRPSPWKPGAFTEYGF